MVACQLHWHVKGWYRHHPLHRKVQLKSRLSSFIAQWIAGAPVLVSNHLFGQCAISNRYVNLIRILINCLTASYHLGRLSHSACRGILSSLWCLLRNPVSYWAATRWANVHRNHWKNTPHVSCVFVQARIRAEDGICDALVYWWKRITETKTSY